MTGSPIATRNLVGQLGALSEDRPLNRHYGVVQSYNSTTHVAVVLVDGASTGVPMRVKAGYNNGANPSSGDHVSIDRVASDYLLDDKIR